MKIKTMAATAVVAILAATGARADGDGSGNWLNTRFCYDTSNSNIFNAHETTLDLFGIYQAETRHFIGGGPFDHGSWGAGLGANYFFTRYLGIGGEVSFLVGQPRLVNNAGGNLYARLPIDKIHLAPYVFGGGGFMFNGIGFYPVSTGYADVGAGLEWRLNPHFGIFGDARYIWRSGSAVNQSAVRAGVRLGF